jgi:phosphoribosylamine--glycine ligase
MATVMVLGSGGREAAQALALAGSAKVAKVLVAPGNGGTAQGHPKICNVNIKETALDDLVQYAEDNRVTLTVVGPEAPLVIGVADKMAAVGIPCFGPTKAAAQLENSKAWMKEFFKRHNLPTARYETFSDFDAAKSHVESIDYPVVVKASGLAAGKGVLIPTSKDETIAALRTVMVDKEFGDAGNECVVEEMLFGPECSVLAFCDGTTSVCMPGAQDHKRALDNDEGLNTGGMGAYAPCPCLTPELAATCADIVQRTVTALASEGTPYVGVLFGGFMLTAQGPQLLEYNVRMGDPETEVVIPLLDSDLYEVMYACTQGKLSEQNVRWSSDAATTVVMAAPGYPGSYPKGIPIKGLEAAAALKNVTVYHAGTKLQDDGSHVTSGGRVLTVTGRGTTLKDAVARAYAGVAEIVFECPDGAHYRKDIAAKALGKA